MAYEQEYINSLHIKMHNTFKEVIAFLESQNLMWFVSAGTAIGAIRHHDFIPWDDDIDIFMPRNDYKRLLSMKHLISSSTGLELLDIDDEGYTQWFAKFVDKYSTTTEDLNIPYMYGVWVDVFPLDYSCNNAEAHKQASDKYKSLFLEYQQSIFPLNIKDIINDFFSLRFSSLLNRVLSHVLSTHKLSLKQRFKDYEESLQVREGDYLVSYCSGGRVFEKTWFESSVWVVFADYQVRVPIGVDAYLKSVYGDYMVMPRVEERVTHKMLYVNLKERLSKQEVKVRINAGESFVGL